ncbi:alanine dehydrogenase [Crenobacter cavernae]|uniref:Alanine dehydrogenase n=1 Tax=Crenobacter cavernae TaxID=2290923 RepID=A0ABY0FB13_9NEIS|nr:alanine dehydrogenase [Crenobacter cavernae]RXZ42771.1 alanine dehydrogenase [Crenobacter cavernae]
MRIGVPKEVKNHEYRVGLTPSGVRELVAHGHKVLVQAHAGLAIGFSDEQYLGAGAAIVSDAEAVFGQSDLVIKVKEPQPVECRMLRPGQVLFAYLHLAPDPNQATLLMESKAVAIAYETVTDERGGLPLLAPMSEVAGRMAIQAGAHALEKAQGGRGVLLSGVPGVLPARVVVLGGGVVGLNAARTAMGLGADVIILDKSLPRLKDIDNLFGGRIKTLFSSQSHIEDAIRDADLVVGAVLVPGAAAPRLVSRSMLKTMKAGAVLVDVAIDQGGCFETSRPTTHQEPTYIVDGIVHYCVANMPGGVARTATQALTHATLPYALLLADQGWRAALTSNMYLRNGLNVCLGKITHPAVADALGQPYVEPLVALAQAE